MTANTAQSCSLEVRRLIRAPRSRVYQAWTDPAQLKEWFGPENVQTLELDADVRVGGKYRWRVRNDDGEEMTAKGEYLELVPDKKLVFTWGWLDDEDWASQVSIVTVELTDADGGTEVRLTHEKLPSELSRDRHAQGWQSILNKLEKFVDAA